MSASIAQLHSWRRGFFGTPRFACSGYARRSWRLAATRAAPRRLSCATAYFHHRCDLLGRSRPLASYGAKFPASDLVLRKSLVLPPIAILPPSMRSNTSAFGRCQSHRNFYLAAWGHSSSTFVRCRMHNLIRGRCLTAVAKISCALSRLLPA